MIADRKEQIIINRPLAEFKGNILLMNGGIVDHKKLKAHFGIDKPEELVYTVDIDNKRQKPDLCCDYTLAHALHSIPDQHFKVVCFAGTDAMRDYGLVFKHVFRVLKEDGILIFSGGDLYCNLQKFVAAAGFKSTFGISSGIREHSCGNLIGFKKHPLPLETFIRDVKGFNAILGHTFIEYQEKLASAGSISSAIHSIEWELGITRNGSNGRIRSSLSQEINERHVYVKKPFMSSVSFRHAVEPVSFNPSLKSILLMACLTAAAFLGAYFTLGILFASLIAGGIVIAATAARFCQYQQEKTAFVKQQIAPYILPGPEMAPSMEVITDVLDEMEVIAEEPDEQIEAENGKMVVEEKQQAFVGSARRSLLG